MSCSLLSASIILQKGDSLPSWRLCYESASIGEDKCARNDTRCCKIVHAVGTDSLWRSEPTPPSARAPDGSERVEQEVCLLLKIVNTKRPQQFCQNTALGGLSALLLVNLRRDCSRGRGCVKKVLSLSGSLRLSVCTTRRQPWPIHTLRSLPPRDVRPLRKDVSTRGNPIGRPSGKIPARRPPPPSPTPLGDERV